MITLSKLLIGIGTFGTAGLVTWGAYYVSTPETIKDKLSRGGLRILNLNKDDNTDADAWKQKIKDHKAITESSDQADLKISGLDLSSGTEQDEEDIRKFKEKCNELLLTFLGNEGVSLKEQQARKWCIEGPKTNND